MTDREFKERLQKSVNSTLSCLEPSARQCDRIVQETLEGKKVMKKHISFALVLVILILVFTMSTAVAVSLRWREYAFEVKQTEHELGEYEAWPDAQRIQLAKDILAMGYLEDSEDTGILSDEAATEQEKAAAADRLMLQLTGLDNLREIDLDVITYSIFGFQDEWAPEARVWWQQVTNMYRDPDADPNTFVVPTENDLPESEAIRIAKEAIIEAYELPADELDDAKAVADLYITKQRPEYRRWAVNIIAHPEADMDSRKYYEATVDCDGNVIADPDLPSFSVWEMAEQSKQLKIEEENKPQYEVVFTKYLEQNNHERFWEWPYTVKAACSAEIIPLTEKFESLPWEVAEATTYRYGLPQSDDMPYEDALNKTYETIEAEYGLTSEQAKCYSKICGAFDITDENNTKWKFVLINPDDWYGLRYRVIIDSKTEDVMLVEEVPWDALLQDMEYDLKYY